MDADTKDRALLNAKARLQALSARKPEVVISTHFLTLHLP